MCFGNVLFEMSFGFPRPSTVDLSTLKDKCASVAAYELLTKIFSQKPPSINDLIQHPFFSNPNSSNLPKKSTTKLPSKVQALFQVLAIEGNFQYFYIYNKIQINHNMPRERY